LTCCATDPAARRRGGRLAAAVPALALALATMGAGGCASTPQTGAGAEELTNPRLGPQYSQWLVGPISRLATPSELDAFAALGDDAAAQAFVERFWEARDPSADRPGNPVREAFDSRAAEADKRYSEAGYLGRRTARGTIYVLFGPPGDVDYQIPPDPRDPPIEVWEYTEDVSAGLSGERPARFYRFIKRGDVTVYYIPRSRLDNRLPGIDEY
jgi:GWxTD domain-containing protein